MSYADTVEIASYPAFVGAVPPPDPNEGAIWIDTSTGAPALRVYQGNTWLLVATGGGGGGTGLPPATTQNQLLVSGPGPAFAWAVNDFDEGRY